MAHKHKTFTMADLTRNFQVVLPDTSVIYSSDTFRFSPTIPPKLRLNHKRRELAFLRKMQQAYVRYPNILIIPEVLGEIAQPEIRGFEEARREYQSEGKDLSVKLLETTKEQISRKSHFVRICSECPRHQMTEHEAQVYEEFNRAYSEWMDDLELKPTGRRVFLLGATFYLTRGSCAVLTNNSAIRKLGKLLRDTQNIPRQTFAVLKRVGEDEYVFPTKSLKP